jgi:diguanylate cyclase (GGDEF)-like protein
LTYGDAAYGAVQVFTATTTWEERTLDLLAALAQEAAVAMENARLLTEVRRLSVTDELTGLYHRSEFRRLLEEEVERARAGGGSVAVLLFDIDGMRAINTEHGHQAGDEVLLAFADMLRRFIRAQDVAARYGGDEFAVLLPGGGFDGARAVANRLCHNLAQKPFHFAGEQAAHHFTISVGVVVATEMPNNGDQLVGRADQALFEARRVGGGQVRFWPAHGIGPRHPCLGEDGIIGQLGRMVSGRRDPSGPEGASEQWR